MPFPLADFVRLRPFLYHLTSTSNVGGIATDLRIHSAAYWIAKCRRQELLRAKRPALVEVVTGKRRIELRDQAPLYNGKMQLTHGLTFEDFVELLNGRVFFWPGDAVQPNGYGQRHFSRYGDDPVSVIRINTDDLFKANSDLTPEFCRFNSGSPRPSNGIRSPRGKDTFVAATKATFSAGKVVEVTYRDSVRLPESAMISKLKKWKWKRLVTEGR